MTIVEFLEARIAEDEARASSGWARLGDSRWETDNYGRDFLTPSAVLAECAAKRAIIKQHEDWPVLVERAPSGDFDANDTQSMVYRMTREIAWLTEREYVRRFGVEPPTTPMLRALATVYKDHPDYDENWAL
jgi:hypothetical protein